MNRTVLVFSMVITWILLIVSYQIETTTGIKFDMITGIAGLAFLYGLYAGLYKTNNYDQEGES